MNFLHGTRESLSAAEFRALASYRHGVFVRQLGWPIGTPNGLELDEFDEPNTEYVVAVKPDGRVGGCARLLPTTRPYLLQRVFPHLLAGERPPQDPQVWELSRFAAVDLEARRGDDPQLKALRSGQILLTSVLRAAALGAKRLLTVSPLGIERLLRRMGAHAHRAGPPCMVSGEPVFACWIELDVTTLSALSCYAPMPAAATAPAECPPAPSHPPLMTTQPSLIC